MSVSAVANGIWQINLGAVNAFLLEDSDGLTLIDTGVPGSAEKIASAAQSVGRDPKDIRRIIVTHCHPDHAGSAAALKRLTNASIHMHAIDAAMVRGGKAKRTMKAAPGVLRPIMFRLFVANAPSDIEPCAIDHEVADGDRLAVAGGLRAIHVPGHCAGQIALLRERDGVLFVADAASNMPTFGLSLGYENLDEGVRSLSKIAALDFDIACFGHGSPIKSKASAKFQNKWGSRHR